MWRRPAAGVNLAFLSSYRKHYLEYLSRLIRQHSIDTLPLLSADDLETVIRREHRRLPPRPYGTPTSVYHEKLLKVFFFLLNRSHYIEYLVRLIGRNRLDPLPILDLTDVWQELRRHGRALPDRGPWDTDAIYLVTCSKVKIDVKCIRGL